MFALCLVLFYPSVSNPWIYFLDVVAKIFSSMGFYNFSVLPITYSRDVSRSLLVGISALNIKKGPKALSLFIRLKLAMRNDYDLQHGKYLEGLTDSHDIHKFFFKEIRNLKMSPETKFFSLLKHMTEKLNFLHIIHVADLSMN